MFRNIGVAFAAAGIALTLVMTQATGQEGYPLDGTWRGDWGAAKEQTHVVLIMKYDGEHINGMINPGPDALHYTQAELHPQGWTVHLEADSPKVGKIVIDGTLKDIGSYHRYIEGTWTQGGHEYPFKIVRQ